MILNLFCGDVAFVAQGKQHASMRIPVLRPLLPQANKVLPYLKRIDASRYYSNYGPLVLELEERLAAKFGLPTQAVTTVANATQGLTAALMSLEVPQGMFCAMPAWTFIATSQAARLAGLKPWFFDVAAETWALDPDAVERALKHAPGPVGAVIPVLPFGQPIDIAGWERFRERTGIHVLIDAAAGFDSIEPCDLPCVVSLHATKSLGCGEGGVFLCRDTALVRRVRNFTVFGFEGTRSALRIGGNSKMSEYTAAVGLAALDEWEITRADFVGRGMAYRRAFDGHNQVCFPDGFGQKWIAATCVVALPDGTAPLVETVLHEAGIEARHWWGSGAHEHPANADCPVQPVPNTWRLAQSSIGLPFWRDLPNEAIELVARTTMTALTQRI